MAMTCATAWTSRRPPSRRATGRCCATTRGWSARARIRCSSTRKHRVCRSRATRTTRRATRSSLTAIPTRPGACSTSRRRTSPRAGATTNISPRCPARPEVSMIDLSTRYLGLPLGSPLVASASPLCESLDNIRAMEDAGAGAVVLHSLFEEQLDVESTHLDRYLTHGGESYAEALDYFPDLTGYNLGPDGYLDHVRRAKEAVGIPIIGSLNGVSTGGWIEFAKKIEQAGADALELNVYYVPTDPLLTGVQVERMYADLVRDVKASVSIPVAVKLGHSFTALANVARHLDLAGADALVLFNRFYLPDFDLERLEAVPRLTLSSPHELLVRLHWVAILYGHVRADLAVTGGVHGSAQVLKSMMAGARVAMMTSALLQHGIAYLSRVRADVLEWMETHEYESITQMQGSMSYRSVAEPAAFERANYMKVISSYALRSGVRPRRSA